MSQIESHLLRIIAGEQASSHDDSLDDLLVEIRAANLDPLRLQEVGRFALSQITAHLKAGLNTEKALLQARRTLQ